MSDWIGLGVIVLVLAGAAFGLSRLGAPPREVSPEEFERRVQDARGTMKSAAFGGMYALQKLMNPRGAEAVEAQRDLRAGYYDESERAGEGGDDEGDDHEGDDNGGVAGARAEEGRDASARGDVSKPSAGEGVKEGEDA